MKPLILLLLLTPLALADDTAWPPVTSEAKPWTRWWWLGSGVDKPNLTNGKYAGTCWTPPHRLDVSEFIQAGKNLLEVEVTNLASNRIADLDRRKVSWKVFHEINFVNIDYKAFDAATWKPLPSGLLVPVTLIPLK